MRIFFLGDNWMTERLGIILDYCKTNAKARASKLDIGNERQGQIQKESGHQSVMLRFHH